MSGIKCAVFDFDGTLVNTIDDLAAASNWLLKQYNIKKGWTNEDYKHFVGNGIKKLIERTFDGELKGGELDKAYNRFIEYYDKIKLQNAYAYDGITDALNQLKKKGIKLAVVSNKQHTAAEEMTYALFGRDLFDVVMGAYDCYPKKPDPTTTLIALEKMGCKPNEAIYFGDSDVDMITAHNAKIEAVGCSWGFRSFEELFGQNPSVIIDDASYISKLF